MSIRHSDTTKEIVLALIAKARSGARIETMLPGVVTALGVVSRTLKELEDQEYGRIREEIARQQPVTSSERRPRAKPYRVDGVGPLATPRIAGVGVRKDREESGGGPELVGRSKNGRKVLA